MSTAPQGEYGRRLTLLTDRLGKVTVFAQSAAKPKSHLTGLSRPMTCAEFLLAKGKTAYNLHGANLIASFDGLSQSLEASCYGMYFLELLSYFSQEGMEEGEAKRLLNLTFLALTALKEVIDMQAGAQSKAPHTENGSEADKEPPKDGRAGGAAVHGGEAVFSYELIRRIYELRLLVIEGEYTEMPPQKSDAETSALWESVTKGKLSALFFAPFYETLSEETKNAFCVQVQIALKRFVPLKFKSLEVLHEPL